MPLILVENGVHKGRRFPLRSTGPLSLGRDQTTEICLPDPMVSRRHCIFEVREGAYTIRDLGSANGTFLNGSRIGESALKVGDRILAGETFLTFLDEDSSDPLVGSTLKGYEILERVGRGGMGTVYRARQVSLERYVALKVLAPELVEDPVFVEKFINEARSAARLSHPNIVMVYDIDDDVIDGQRVVYYSMEFMGGGSVEDLLNRKGPLDPVQALRIALETARGLQYAEQVGLVHRDIKPGNLMIHESGAIKIGDLGIAARSAGAGRMASQEGGVSGSPHYISPEQARGQDLDSRADIYSLGASLFQMLAGRPPFSATNLRDLILKHIRENAPDLSGLLPDCPEEVHALVARMLEKNRDLRPANARQLGAEIEGILGRLQSPAGAAPARIGFSRKALLPLAVIAALVAVLALGGLGIQKYLHHRSERARAEQALGGMLEGIGSSIQSGRLEEAEARLDELEMTEDLPRRFPAIAESARSLRSSLEKARSQRMEKERQARAEQVLAELRAGMPDIASAPTVGDLDALVPPLEAFQKTFPETPAARAAADDVARIREAIRSLERKIRRGEDALRSLLITAETFLASSPPRFREALEKLRDPPAEIPGTPSEKRLQEEISAVASRMMREAEAWVREAERDAAAGQAAEAASRLEKLRSRVEGKALEALEAAIRKIRPEEEKP